jgi:serine/threonine-protein kinase RsbW
LNVCNRPENVVLVRQMLAGVAEAIDLDAGEMNDISTAVTEACNNVVLHAYRGEEGPLEIELYACPGAIEVVVRDHGTGIEPRTGAPRETVGIGLSVIQALTLRAEFRGGVDDGTEVQMAFAARRAAPLQPSSEGGLELPAIVEAELATAVEVAIAPAPLARTILPRLLSALAARANFRTDRIADMQLIADALAAHVPRSISGSHLSIGISVEPHDLELRIAPLRAGGADRLMLDSAVDELAPVIGKLSDAHRVASVGPSSDEEMLALRLVDRR